MCIPRAFEAADLVFWERSRKHGNGGALWRNTVQTVAMENWFRLRQGGCGGRGPSYGRSGRRRRTLMPPWFYVTAGWRSLLQNEQAMPGIVFESSEANCVVPD